MLTSPWEFAKKHHSGLVPISQEGLVLAPLGMASCDEKVVSGWLNRKDVSLALALGKLCLVDAGPEERNWLEDAGVSDFHESGGRLLRLAVNHFGKSVVRAFGRDINLRSEGFVLWDMSFCKAEPLPGLPGILETILLQ